MDGDYGSGLDASQLEEINCVDKAKIAELERIIRKLKKKLAKYKKRNN